MYALEINELHKTYHNGVQALKGISFQVKAGDFFALLGPNGAGKSTAIGIMTSLVNKTSGQIKIMEHDIDDDFSAAKSCIGVVPQEFNMSIFETAYNVVLNQAGYYGVPRRIAKERAEHYLKKLRLWDKRNSQVRHLSGGMKRRLMIARGLIHEPQMLVLDEPTAGVDIEIRRSMWDFLQEINKQGTTIILTTHYLEEAEHLCRNVGIIDHGEIVELSSTAELLARLEHERFILYLKEPFSQLPEIAGYEISVVDDMTIEVEVSKVRGMNALFTELHRHNINVSSMRNKRNRLEELFITLTRSEQVDEYT